MRKLSVILFSFFFASFISVSVIADIGNMASLETDPELFAMITGVAHWDVPGGYRMEGFLRTDVNGDNVTDAVILLENTADSARQIAIIMSSPDGYQVIQNEQAMPFGAIGADVFAGLNAGAGYIALYTRKINQECFENEYLLERNESEFLLSKIISLQWWKESPNATQSTFDFTNGQYIQKNGIIQKEGFWVSSEVTYDLPGEIRPESFGYYAPVAWEEPAATTAANAGQTMGEGIFCNACGLYFQTGDMFRSHICAAAPQKTEPLLCKECGKFFDNDEALQSHTCVPPGNEIIKCAVCHQLFSDEESYQNHICISYLDDNSVYCDLCGEWYAEGEAFRSHVCVPR